MKRNRLFAFMLIVIGVAFTCSMLTIPNALAKEKIKIGGIVDLTGPTNDIGVPWAEGVVDYFDKINRAGGINGRLIDYFAIDYQYKLPQAMAAYKRLVHRLISSAVDFGNLTFQPLGFSRFSFRL